MSVSDLGKFVSSLKPSLLLYQIKKKKEDIYKITIRELSLQLSFDIQLNFFT